MERAQFSADLVSELREILLSTSTAEVYGQPGKRAELREEPFLGPWELRSLGFDPSLGRSRVLCKLRADDRDVMATIDASDFPVLRSKRARSPVWNNSQYHDLAVLVSILIQEQILTWDPAELGTDPIRIRLPAGRPRGALADAARDRDHDRYPR
jgi:hypothetical protein